MKDSEMIIQQNEK